MALLAWRARSLTAAGAAAASVVGTLVVIGTGWGGGAVLAAFFVSSSVMSRLSPPPPGLDPKGERRDARQVGANGGPAALGALVALHQPSLGLWIVTGSLAAAAADSWATSLGAQGRAQPRRFMLGTVGTTMTWSRSSIARVAEWRMRSICSLTELSFSI